MAEKPFDRDMYLRALERNEHRILAQKLDRLIDILGYNPSTHQFVHAALFQGVMGYSPKTFIKYLVNQNIPHSRIAVDNVREEALAIINISIERTMKKLDSTASVAEKLLLEVVRGITEQAIIDWEEGTGIDFEPIKQIGERFTVEQSIAYIEKYAEDYAALPGKEGDYDTRTYTRDK